MSNLFDTIADIGSEEDEDFEEGGDRPKKKANGIDFEDSSEEEEEDDEEQLAAVRFTDLHPLSHIDTNIYAGRRRFPRRR